MRKTITRALAALPVFPIMLSVAIAPRATAQAPAPADTGVTQSSLFDQRDIWIGLGFVAATVALTSADKSLAERLQNQNTQANKFFHHAATGTELIASPGAYVIGGGMYLFGRLAHNQRATDLGLHGTEAVFVGDAVTTLVKGFAGRSRPFVSADTNPHDFKFGRGFKGGNYSSFPSGHTTSAFAAAAAVTSTTHGWWPGATWVIAPVMYGGATMVGLSRMYHNKHWASDVIMGAGIGTFAGLKVVRFNHTHQGNRIDRWLMGAQVSSDLQGDASIGWTVPLN